MVEKRKRKATASLPLTMTSFVREEGVKTNGDHHHFRGGSDGISSLLKEGCVLWLKGGLTSDNGVHLWKMGLEGTKIGIQSNTTQGTERS